MCGVLLTHNAELSRSAAIRWSDLLGAVIERGNFTMDKQKIAEMSDEELLSAHNNDQDFYPWTAMDRLTVHTELAARLQRGTDDTRRLDWLADTRNTIGNVQLPTKCVEKNLSSLRDAIDSAMLL
jgi:hypothetical protein